ncbi:putative heat shock protein HspR [bacterium BMS3Abin07]|nr:putative heat shock protein HspR [bacterium BMS3Abin07]GBE33040.1 putative heat shock protein HspR [bacterium BMS3Bbin05]
MISVVSRMLGVHPQTLRLYEREGLICPKRNNRQRLYSEEDIERINFILQLTRELGVNKAGVDIILRMREKLELMHREMDDMMTRLEDDVRAEFERKLRKLFSS